MENFIVSARKYRPVTFETVVGQVSITTTLRNAIKNSHLAHAYLFCGPRGVGKTTCARIFAKTINCQNIGDDYEPCNTCEPCLAFNANRSYNIHELDAASNNSVDDIKQIIDQVRIPPQVGKYKVYIIDEVHMLSSGAFNAFLKTLEEPPAHVIFILATTEKHKIIPTILSRCQIYDFSRIKVEDIVKHLEYVASKEGVSVEHDALAVIAQKSEGAMRDALSFFDQIVSFSGNVITYDSAIAHLNVLDYDYYFKLTEFFLQGNVSESLLTFDEILNNGFDGHYFIAGLAEHLRDLLVSRDQITLKLLEVGDNIRERYKIQSQNCSPDFIFKALKICSNCDINYKTSKNQRLHVEFALMQLCAILSNDNSIPAEIIPIAAKKQPFETKPVVEEVKQEHKVIVAESKPKTYSAKKTEVKQEDVYLLNESLSLKDVTKIKTKKQDPEIENALKPIVIESAEVFTQEFLVEKWTEFALIIKEEKPRLYNTMTAQLPELKDDFVIEVSFNNTSQSDAMREIQTELYNFLVTELKNNKIRIVPVINEQKSEDKKKLYTDSDKFNFLNEKNPNLGLFQQKFNLDFK